MSSGGSGELHDLANRRVAGASPSRAWSAIRWVVGPAETQVIACSRACYQKPRLV
jgi:hypothetical protein